MTANRDAGGGGALADAVAAAAAAVAARAGDDPSLATARLELDVVIRVDGATLDDDLATTTPSIGLEGILAVRDDGQSGFVLPGEIVQRALFQGGNHPKLDRDKVRALVATRAGGLADNDLATMRIYRFGTDGYVEPPGNAGAPLHVTRGMVDHPTEATVDRLLAAVRSGADYLSRILDDQGRYVYVYHPVDDRDDPSYGWLRHSGATYALLEAYDEFRTPRYLSQAKRALDALDKRYRDDPAHEGKYLVDTNDEEQQKVGGAGLAMLALAKEAAVTGTRSRLETMRSLARFIIAQQFDDGHYRANADLDPLPDGKKRKVEPVYYQGEAALGLLRLYALDPQQAYLDSARRACDWVIHVRDADVSENDQEHDHWISYALNELYRVVHDAAYVEHAYKIARAIDEKEHRAKDAPSVDWIGTFYEGQTTPGATRLEAFAADIALSRFAGRPDAWLFESARPIAASMLGQQFDADRGYWLKNPAKSSGGVRESLIVQDVRIDYVQHAMSSWLHFARELRDPAYGKTGAPSQDPVR